MTKEVPSFYRTLGWLPPAPPLRLQVNEALLGEQRALKKVTNCQLTETELRRLSKVSRAMRETPPFLSKISITILSNANFELLPPVIEGAGLRYGLDLRVSVEPMGLIAGWAHGSVPTSTDGRGEVVIVALTADYFERPSLIADKQETAAFLDRAMADLELLRDTLSRRGGALFVQSVPSSLLNVLGSVERHVPGTACHLIDNFNHRIHSSEHVCIEISDLASRIGIDNWSSQRYWHWAKLPFHPENNVAYADAIARALAISRGGTKKCLILDLDNTLWKGVIGDDGLEKIEIGNNSPAGEAHLAIQKFALTLRKRGVLLAICSKNDHDTALTPFKQHAEMLLRLDDIAAFQANWNDKPSNILAIASTLSLGVDSFVFLDDNPMERDIVRHELPDVSVPEVPGDDPTQWIKIVSAGGYFDSYTFTDTDRNRAEQYAANARRAEGQLAASDISSYLRELQMKLVVMPFTEDTLTRVVQLISRSNQFNLTTRRYSLDDIKVFTARRDVLSRSFRLQDKFGDNGIIAVMIGVLAGDVMRIDTWLMSCRVLKRGVEEACLTEFALAARTMGATRLIGEYIPTAKNKMVANLYPLHGFIERSHAEIGEEPGATSWELDLRFTVLHQEIISVSRQ